MKLYKRLTHELSLILIVKFMLLYVLWLLFFNHPVSVTEEQTLRHHFFGDAHAMSEDQVEASN
ncbi:MAG TPA: hypothetical protein ENK06_07575 [Gammaproteobacteria bacterium]|nr:hypothetical protein [Gammaproteobacteria bacterium]